MNFDQSFACILCGGLNEENERIIPYLSSKKMEGEDVEDYRDDVEDHPFLGCYSCVNCHKIVKSVMGCPCLEVEEAHNNEVIGERAFKNYSPPNDMSINYDIDMDDNYCHYNNDEEEEKVEFYPVNTTTKNDQLLDDCTKRILDIFGDTFDIDAIKHAIKLNYYDVESSINYLINKRIFNEIFVIPLSFHRRHDDWNVKFISRWSQWIR